MRKWKLALGIGGIFCVTLAIVLGVLENVFKLTFFFLNAASIVYITWFIVFAICAFTILLLNYFYKFKNNGCVVAFVIIFTSIIAIIAILFTLIFGLGTEPKYFAFKSPYNYNTVVIEEESFLLAGYGSVYKKINPFFIKKVSGYWTDDGYRPFSDGSYQLSWDDNRVIISYATDYMYPERYVDLEVNF